MALLCFSMVFRRALAQDVLTLPPQTPAIPAAVQEYEANNPMQVFASQEEVPSPIPIQWGPVAAHPHVDYEFLYGTGLDSSPGRSQATTIQTVAPGVLFNLGSHWTLDYTPTLNFYSSRDYQDTVNHSVGLHWGTTYGGDWVFSGSQSFVDSADPSVETAAQTDQQDYVTVFNATHQLNDKISVDLGLNQNLNYVGNGGSTTNSLLNLEDTMAWSTADWINYEFWPRFTVGLGVGLGYDHPVGGPDSVNELYQGRINWRATDKISLQLSSGLEDLQYLSGGAGTVATPIFGAAIQYQPFEHTQVSVFASRTVSQSIFQNQVDENTEITVDLSQRLLGKLQLNLSGQYGTTKYVASAEELSTSRSDNLYSFNARLTCPLFKQATVSVFYSYTENSSSQSGFATTGTGYGFTSSQMGLEIGYRY
jgi:hypothetical protein